MEAVVERLARSPRLGLVYRELSDLWKRERSARESFYDSIEDGQKVEFINGETLVHPADQLKHVNARMHVTGILHTYVSAQSLGFVGDEKLLVCLTRNDYMPDVVFYGREKAAKLEPDQLKFPAPDLVVEVLSTGTRRRDRGVKFEDYAAHGVEEYWVVDPEARSVEVFLLNALGRYGLIQKASGFDDLRSGVLAGFKVPVAAVFDDRANLAALKKLLK